MLARAIIHFIFISQEENPDEVEVRELIAKRLIDYVTDGRLRAHFEGNPSVSIETFGNAVAQLKEKLGSDPMATGRLDELQSALGLKAGIEGSPNCGNSFNPQT
jgi:hypothetical protein